MQNIRIQALRLENFKCHKYLNLDFQGRSASLYGDNAAGKTSVYDALTWLLFGKDSLGNGEKNMEVKPLGLDGQVADHQAVTVVEATLLVNGEPVTLRRTLQEVWSAKRGSRQETFDGNTSEYYVDGVPCKLYAFKEKIRELVDEEQFRLLTSVRYFPQDMPWKNRREILADRFGILSDREIMASDARFASLLSAIGKLSPEEYKARLLAEKKGLAAAKNDIPARLSECEKILEDLQGLDFDDARREVSSLEKRLADMQEELRQLSNGSDPAGKKLELREANLALETLEHENRCYRDSQRSAELPEMQERLRQLERQISQEKLFLARAQADVKKYQEAIESCRKRWISIDGERYLGQTVCPTCGQDLPKERQLQAQAAFEAEKQIRKRDMESQASEAKEHLREAEERETSAKNGVQELEQDAARLRNRISAAQQPGNISDLPEYASKKEALMGYIQQLQDAIYQASQDSAAARRKQEQAISKVREQLQEQQAISAKEAVLHYTQKRIADILEEAARGAQKLADIEGMLDVLEEFSRYKAGFVEEQVNGRFRLARFRLFREQANGGLEDRCDVTYHGIPYYALNSGAKINVGIDIINTLSQAYGVSVPLFVDNAESVTRLERGDAQVIRLVVSEKDKALRIDYEN